MRRNRIFLLLVIPVLSCFPYKEWTPTVGPAKDLLCSTKCMDDKCCSCFSKPKWELGQETLGNLHIEYVTLGVASAKFVSMSNLSESIHLQAVHFNGRLRSFPRNTCDFKNLVKINFANNVIENIGVINCLVHLDTLILTGNRIKHISNMTFTAMPSLRKLDLSNNVIKTLDANTFAGNMTNIFHVDFSNNNFESVDITNVLRENFLFCKINFENAMNGSFTNVHNITMDPDKVYNSGDVSFVGCVMDQDMFSVLSRDNPRLIQQLPLMIQTGIYDFANAVVKCDCSIALSLKAYWKFIPLNDQLEGLKCMGQNDTTVDMHDPKTYDLMICNIHKNCPKFCTCIEQPTQWRIIVNCSFTEMQRLPIVLPDSAFLVELLVSNNNIKHLEHRDYFHRLRILDLSDNGVISIDNNTEESFYGGSLLTLDLRNHSLDDLPKSFRYLNPNYVFFGNKGIRCTCGNTWIGEWRERGIVNSSNPLFCENVKNGTNQTLVEHAKPFLGDCSESEFNVVSTILLSTFLGLALIALTSTAVISIFSLESVLLLRKLKRRIRKDDLDSYKYDVFVSFDEEDDDARRFVMNYLLKILHSSNYTTYVPCRDMLVGHLREILIKATIQQCRTFLCILSEKYSDDEQIWTRMEFTTAWKYSKIINVINIDNLDSGDVRLRELRAYLRLKFCIEITTRRDIFKQLIGCLGKPLKDMCVGHHLTK